MPPISRRLFLIGSVSIAVAACSGDDTASNGTDASGTTTDGSSPGSSPSTTATTLADTTTSTTSTTSTTTELASDPFTLGVASGDPDPTGVVLWTRILPEGAAPVADVPVGWELAADESFADVVASGTETATAASGYSVHAVVEAAPGSYWYRFTAGTYTSPRGRTLVPAADGIDEIVFASANCQHYETGYYAAHRDIAESAPHFVLWLGDYIYEDGPGGEGALQVREHDSPEVMDLAAYRNRYAQYRRDPDLQAAHHACPWVVIWDDHEVENNYAGLQPENALDEATFAARRALAYQAWWEHMPVRLPPPDAAATEYRTYRSSVWGDLLDISLLDGRQYRTDQACGDVTLSTEPACAETADPARTMLGAEQEAWLAARLAGSTATWTALGQQTVMTDVRVGEAVLNFDQWDGYPAARQRLIDSVRDAELENLVVVTGDIHLAAVGRVGDAQGPVGVELVTTSISSAALIDDSLQALLSGFPNIVDIEVAHRGYTRHTVTADRWVAEYRIVDDVAARDSPVSTWRTFTITSGSTEVVEA